jgi:uncharacterized protein YlxW (UPF0749 family)
MNRDVSSHEVSAAPEVSPVNAPARTSRRNARGSNWIYSLTAICFLCGALMAMQLRAHEEVQRKRQENAEATVELREQVERQRRLAAASDKKAQDAQRQFTDLQKRIAANANLTKTQAQQLNARIKELQLVAGITPATGPGIRIEMRDNPEAAEGNPGNPFLPGIVHDFDLLQVVNELRAAGAEAISVNGMRITGYTPIRCVGPTIHVNFEPATPPFVIEAVGDPKNLYSAVTMPGGIIYNLKNPEMGPALPIKIARLESLTLPAATGTGGVPRLKVARAPEPKPVAPATQPAAQD